MIDNFPKVEDQVEEIVRNLIHEKQYVEFLVGRDGDFDQIVASTVRRVKRAVRDDNSVLVWVICYTSMQRMEEFKLPKLFMVSGYTVYSWSNENGEPIHVPCIQRKTNTKCN